MVVARLLFDVRVRINLIEDRGVIRYESSCD